MEMHRLAPKWPLVALTNYDFLQVGKPGASPWLGGIDADDYDGDFVKAAAADPRRHGALAELRLPAERQGRRPRLPLLPRPGDGRRRRTPGA